MIVGLEAAQRALLLVSSTVTNSDRLRELTDKAGVRQPNPRWKPVPGPSSGGNPRALPSSRYFSAWRCPLRWVARTAKRPSRPRREGRPAWGGPTDSAERLSRREARPRAPARQRPAAQRARAARAARV